MINTPPQERNREIKSILIWILALNWLAALAKVTFGLLSRSASMTADGFHSLADGASNIIGLIGITLACRPIDKDHPYGHKKYETLFSLAIAGLLFIICFNLMKEGVSRLFNPVTPQVDIKSFVVMIITLGINFTVMRYEYKKGKLLQSDILVSDSMHTRADILISTSVIITLVMIRLGFPILDPIITLIISIFIAHTGFEIARRSSDVLCDAIAIVDEKKIEAVVKSIEGVKTCHKIRSRGRPDDIHLDLHVQVTADMHMDRAHKISYTIEEKLKKEIPGVTDVVVHMEPLGKCIKGLLR
jgi:cation diffusion facilitator family transporter